MQRLDLRIFNYGKHILMFKIKVTLLLHDIFYMSVSYYLFVQNVSPYFCPKIKLTIFKGKIFFSKIMCFMVLSQASSLFKETCLQAQKIPI